MTATDTNDVITNTFGDGQPDDDDPPTPVRVELGDFEGQTVNGIKLELRNAAGGLNAAMDVAPLVLHMGDEFDVTCRCRVVKVRHQPEDTGEPDGPVFRVQIADVLRAVMVDQSLAQAEFDRQAERQAERDQIEGQQKLDTTVGGEQGPPLDDYDSLNAADIIARVEDCGDSDEDVELVDAIEVYEEAHGGRATILKAIKNWRDG